MQVQKLLYLFYYICFLFPHVYVSNVIHVSQTCLNMYLSILQKVELVRVIKWNNCWIFVKTFLKKQAAQSYPQLNQPKPVEISGLKLE